MTPTKMRALAGLTYLAIAALCNIAEGKPTTKNNHRNHHHQKDPILAMPTNDQPTPYEMVPSMQMIPYLQAPSQDAAMSYITSPNYQIQYYPEPQAQQPAPPTTTTTGQGDQPTTEMRQEIHYILRPENQITPEPSQTDHLAPTNVDQYGQPITTGTQDQVISVQGGSGSDSSGSDNTNAGEITRGEYPGEIIYLGQNGELDKFSNGQQESPNSATKESLSNLGGMISGSSGVPATILTEVPARDMPEHLLEKLKREYGIKVVATREYPGANLVINCDDDSNQQGGTICAKPVAFTTTSSNAPYSLSRSSSISTPNEEYRPSNVVEGGQPANYATLENIGSRANQDISSSNFGSRNNLSLTNEEEYNTNARAELEALANGPEQSQQVHPAKAEGQQDSEAGFDVPPPTASATENEESKKHEQDQ